MVVACETVLLLGGNLGELPATFAKAEALINERIGTVLARSRAWPAAPTSRSAIWRE